MTKPETEYEYFDTLDALERIIVAIMGYKDKTETEKKVDIQSILDRLLY